MTTPFWARRDQCTAGAVHFHLKVHRKASLSSATDQGLDTEEKTVHPKLHHLLKVTEQQKLKEDSGKRNHVVKLSVGVVDNLQSPCPFPIKIPAKISEQAAGLMLVQTFIQEIRLQNQGH